jgi:hypothetical protein
VLVVVVVVRAQRLEVVLVQVAVVQVRVAVREMVELVLQTLVEEEEVLTQMVGRLAAAVRVPLFFVILQSSQSPLVQV